MLNPRRAVQQSIRQVHVRWLDRGLPGKVAVYLHSLEAGQRPAFCELVRYFQASGYEFCDPGAFVAASSGKQIFLSFDDNYRSWYESAELFDQLGIRATFYLNTAVLRDAASSQEIENYYDRVGHGGKRVPLSTSELREVAAGGHVIGCHTHSHVLLTSLPLAEAQGEILTGKRQLEDILGSPVTHFSYPFGMRRHFSEALRHYCLGLGFQTIANAIPGMQHCPQKAGGINRSPWALDRPLGYNLQNLAADGSLFARLTGRSAVT